MTGLWNTENPIAEAVDGRIKTQSVREFCFGSVVLESIAARGDDAYRRTVRRYLHSASTQRPIKRHVSLLSVLSPSQTCVDTIASGGDCITSLQLDLITRLQLRFASLPCLGRNRHLVTNWNSATRSKHHNHRRPKKLTKHLRVTEPS